MYVRKLFTNTFIAISVPLNAVIKPLSRRVSVGSSLTINCSMNGNPIAELIWLKDGKPLFIDGIKYKSNAIADTIATLTIQSIAFEEKGIYQCFVSNDEHSAQTSILITISFETFN
ncbi:down syndrome cell adhesion molecule-like isoform x99 [Leptotrombidium deliense]|uniref:Down syndrome cell adhesion molecule-like isoform x99 n=1 Tax=Leptotrombidium deliense TaxID=299467 RepID=A0A443SRQ0_9ACAR|nr:down syndrome cell adhesion molecule-like isoform x99 [Leptotrombidium deliense]